MGKNKGKKLEIDKIKPSVVGYLSEKRVKALVKDMRVGDPIPIDEVPIRRKGGRTLDHWLALCKSIPPGHAQRITGYSTSAARNAIERLVALKLLPDEFIVRARGKRKGEQTTYIVHFQP